MVSKKWNDDVVKLLTGYREALKPLSSFDALLAKSTLETVANQLGIQTGKIMQAFRICITGGASGPDLMVTLEILGKEEVIKRITYALQTLKVKA
jgi:glutamyl-tRNA synthetase